MFVIFEKKYREVEAKRLDKKFKTKTECFDFIESIESGEFFQNYKKGTELFFCEMED